MKRKIASILSLVVVLALMCGTLASCFLFPTETKEYTLTLYDNDGTTVLHTIKVEEGKAPEKPADPTKEGYVFSGWFVTPTSSKAFDFSAAMSADAKAYAQWKMADFQDDRDWVLSGSINGWGSKLDDYHLTKKAGTGNVYELTLDLYVTAFTKLLSTSMQATSSRSAPVVLGPISTASLPW